MKNKKQIKVTFHGGVGWVTGANFLLENVPHGKNEKPTKILIDCGMFQGGVGSDELNRSDFSYHPADIDFLIVTHAHADHIGRIPKLVRDGFRGKIYSTEATYDLALIMLNDSLNIITQEAKKQDKEPLFEEDDVKHTLSLWKYVSLRNPLEIPGGFTVTFHEAGHILGSAMAKFSYGNKNILFTGDIGNSPDPLLKDTEIVDDADYMIIESVYGDRNHEDKEERIEKLKHAIMETIARKGVLLIPSFALERTQNILFILNNLIENGEVPEIPVFLDSPLAIDITNVFRKHIHLLNAGVQERLQHDDDVFRFPRLKETYTVNDSKAILHASNPKVIISSAGMSHAGRIIHHQKQYLGNPDTMVLFVGYQSVGTVGRIIQDGAEKVTLLGEEIVIRAKRETITGYSAHKDSDGLLDFVSHSQKRLRHVYVAMGETKAALFLVQRIRDYLGIRATAPDVDESVVLDME